MDRRKKIILAALVLLVGVGLALQFRKIESAKLNPAASSAWHDSVQVSSQPGVDNSTKQQWQRAADTTTAFDGRIEAASGNDTNAVANADSARIACDSSASVGLSRVASPIAVPAGSLVDLNVPEQTHKIVDGDTLQNLSQRYLGRPDRYLELYEYNRDLLKSPDVLPIGAELRIPSQVAMPPGDQASISPVVPSTPLAPLVPLPRSQTATPTAKPAIPVASQRITPHTYTVLPGDNLVDLARKFYGDGRKYESLYEANRNVMHNPTDLRPGMVLTVP